MFRLSLHSVAWGHRCHRGSADLVPQMADVGSGEQVQEGFGSTSFYYTFWYFLTYCVKCCFFLRGNIMKAKLVKVALHAGY